MHKDLFKEGLITESAFKQIEAITNRKVISLYYELRMFLYLGIMLFTGGVGYIVYENIGSIGHIVAMLLMAGAIGTGFYFIDQKSKPYAHTQVKVEGIYFDYLLLLVGLLIISLFTYIQVYFELVDLLIRWTSLVTGVLFIFLAYRYDNKMLLSLGITALAAAVGLTLSPYNWASGKWLSGAELYVLSLSVGIVLLVAGQFLNRKNIKRHFTFTYHHFGWLLFYFGALIFMADSSHEKVVAIILMVLSSAIMWYTWKQRSFLFFIYASIACYTVVTFLLFQLDVDWEFFIFYFPVTAIASVILLVKNRHHFSDDK